MARQVSDIVLTGQGLLVTFNDNTKYQFVWKFINGRLTLTLDGQICPGEIVDEIIGDILKCNQGTSLWAHLFGVASDHLSASATTQLDLNLTPNTWTPIIFNNPVIEGETGELEVDTTTGIITLPQGEFYIDSSIVCHRSGSGGSDGVIVSVHAYDIDTGLEIPYSFYQSTTPALNNAPLALKTNFLLDTGLVSGTRFQIEVQADSNRCALGANPGKVPAGSLNHVANLNIFRIG